MKINMYELKAVKEKSFNYDCGVGQRVACDEDLAEISKAIGFEEFAEEHLGMFCLNAAGMIIGYYEVSKGDLTSPLAHPREIFKRAILSNAGSIALVHNHPSGNTEPSQADIATAKRLQEAGQLIGIPLIDSLIIGCGCYTSLKTRGVL